MSHRLFHRIAATLALLLLSTALGAAETGYLGLRVRAVPEGGRVLGVLPGSPAEAAGLMEGDVITFAGSQALAGLPVKTLTEHLKGPQGSQIALKVSRFPAHTTVSEVTVTRGPPQERGGRVVTLIPEGERLANQWMGNLRRGQLPPLGAAVPEATFAPELGEIDPLLVALDQAGSLWWVAEGAQARRDAFWEALAADEAVRGRLMGSPTALRLPAARLLAAHKATAGLALALIEGAPDNISTQQTRQLAAATAQADIAAVAALRLPAADLVGPSWQASLGLELSDLAALELATPEQGPRSGPPPSLPAQVAQRLELVGAPLPWNYQTQETGFGDIAPADAPAFALSVPGGGELVLNQHGGPVVLAFWATWCGPCREELPQLDALATELAATGLQIWAISLDDDADVAAAYFKERGLKLPLAMGDRALRDAYQIGPIPRTVVLDAKHRIIRDHAGFSQLRFEHHAEEIRALAAGQLPSDRQLGAAISEAQRLKLVATGLVGEAAPLALFNDAAGRPWVATEEQALPLSLEAGALVVDQAAAVPLAFAGDDVAWVDLDQDGTQEIVSATRGGTTVRLSKASGEAVFTQRHADELRGVSVWRDTRGQAFLAVVRVAYEGTPAAPQANDAPRPANAQPAPMQARARIELFDATGTLTQTVQLQDDVVRVEADPSTGRVALVMRAGGCLVLQPDGTLAPAPVPPGGARGAGWLDLDADGTAELVTSDNGATLAPTVLGSALVLTAGGTLVALDADGHSSTRLRFQKRTTLHTADLNADGIPDVLLYAPGFGLALLTASP